MRRIVVWLVLLFGFCMGVAFARPQRQLDKLEKPKVFETEVGQTQQDCRDDGGLVVMVVDEDLNPTGRACAAKLTN